jgi:FixJ family two-component response regulator
LILDVQMPGMDGLELQQRLAAASFPIPIIFITAYNDEDVRTQAMRGGALSFLTKPFSDDALLGAVQSAIEVEVLN